MSEKLFNLATCQFPVSSDITANARYIRQQMRSASNRGAAVAHFPEACLSGYGGMEFSTWRGFDWHHLRELTEEIAALAKELALWVMLGSSHPLSGRRRPHNCLYVINSSGRLLTRYDKRLCTTGDLEHYSPGDHETVFTIKGVKCAALICYEVRFPELYRAYQQQHVRLVFHSFYNAAATADTIHTVIMRPTLQGHAASNNMFISGANAATPRQSWPSVFIEPDGVIKRSLPRSKSGVMVNTVDAHKEYYDASGPFRRACIQGRHYSGKLVKDRRS